MMQRALLLAVALLAPATAPLRAQSAHDLVERGLTAYRALDYDQAAALLRRGLVATGRTALPDSARATTWVYFGATQLFRGRRDSANMSFRLALAADPRCRADTLIFPPEVTDAFGVARRGTAFVRIRVPADTTVAAGGEYPLRLYASSPHEATVALIGADGRDSRRLYVGSLADSLDLRWDPRDAAGSSPSSGTLVLQVTSRPLVGPPQVTRLPLTVRAIAADTLVPPPPPTVKDPAPGAGRMSGRPINALAAGVLSGLAVVLLPKVVASDGDGGSARFVVGGTLGLAGVLGFAARRSPATPMAAANRAALAAWRRAADSVSAENARRRQGARLQVTAGAQDAPDLGGP